MVKDFIKGFLNKRGKAIYPYNAYREKLDPVRYDWLKKLDINLVVDVGASNGGFARKIKSLIPNTEIISFEPLTKPFNDFKQNFINDPSVKAHQLVLSDEVGEVTFYENENSGSSSMLKMTDIHKRAYPFTERETELKVESTTLDIFFNKYTLENKRTLLKMDVQGAEHKVLKGGMNFLKHCWIVFCEVNFDELYEGAVHFKDLNRTLEQEGFELYGMENVSQSTIDGSFLQADAFFVRKDKVRNELQRKS